MSLVVVVCFKTGDIGIWGDTVVTRRVPVGPIVGRTSQGELLSPRTDKEGVLYFDEGACKVGSFGNRSICGITTDDADFAIHLLTFFDQKLENPSTLDEFQKAIYVATEEFAKVSAAFGYAQYSIVTEFVEGRYFLNVEINRDSQGEFEVILQNKKIVKGEEWLGTFGSGAPWLGDIEKAGLASLAEIFYQQPELINVLSMMVANCLSSWLNVSTRGQAPGFGGAFLGYIQSDNGIVAASEAMHIQGVHLGDISVYSKHTYANSFFYVHDLVQRHLTKFETLDGRMLRYRGKEFDRSKDEERAISLQATLTILDVQPDASMPAREIAIIGNGSGETLKADFPEKSGVMYLKDDEEFEITLNSGNEYKFKMPLFKPR